LKIERYTRNKEAAEKYHLVQFGIALFLPAKAEENDLSNVENFIVYTFNFYVFPNSKNPLNNNAKQDVVLDPFCINFLAENNMDFNKWLKEGVPYQNKNVVDQLRARFNVKWGDGHDPPRPKTLHGPIFKVNLVRPEDKIFVKSVMDTVDTWFNANEADEVKDLPSCNSFLRRALYELLEEKYGNDLIIEKCPNTQQIRIMKWNKSLRLKSLSNLENNEIGLFRIVEALSNECTSRHLPIVVHNGMIDLLYLLSHFFVKPLPEYFDEFRSLFSELFPFIFDTKLIAKELFKDIEGEQIRPINTTLEVLAEFFREKGNCKDIPEITFPNSEDASQDQAHSAGYDAFLTGTIFLHLSRRIKGLNDMKNKINLWRGNQYKSSIRCFYDLNVRYAKNVLKRKLSGDNGSPDIIPTEGVIT